MKVVIVKAKLEVIDTQLTRIADCLEAICRANNIIVGNPTIPEFESVSYTPNEYNQIVTEHRAKK